MKKTRGVSLRNFLEIILLCAHTYSSEYFYRGSKTCKTDSAVGFRGYNKTSLTKLVG